jgi:hypothetical protein
MTTSTSVSGTVPKNHKYLGSSLSSHRQSYIGLVFTPRFIDLTNKKKNNNTEYSLWTVDQLPDLFRTTHRVKTQQVVKSRGHHSGDIEFGEYLQNKVGTVPLVLVLLITHERWGSNTDPTLNGHLHHPNDLNKPLNEVASDTIRKFRTDYKNNPPNNTISFMSTIVLTSGRLHGEFVRILFLQAHRETDRFFAPSGVQLTQHNRGGFHYHRSAFSRQIKTKTDSNLPKASVLRLISHPSHSQVSRLLTSSLSSGVPVPRATQCM